MTWMSLDTWIVVVGVLCAAACALPGAFLVLRKMSMMGDAISHAVLPGLAIAFLITGSRASLTMFIGAAVVGILTAVFTQWIHRFGKVDQGASMGVVFTTMFAIGLLIMSKAAHRVDLDPGCVLYGAIELTPLDVAFAFPFGSGLVEVPRAAIVLLCVLLFNIGVIWIFFKELKLSSFDPELATTLGFNASHLHYLLMVLVAVTAVAAFEAVGSILVIAMLIVPPATALLLTRRLVPMLWTSVACGALAAILGHVGAVVLPPMLGFAGTSSAGMMASAAGLIFLAAWVWHLLRVRAATRGISTSRI